MQPIHQHSYSHATTNIHSSRASPLTCTNIPTHMQLSTSTAHMHLRSHTPTSQLICSQYTSIPTHMQLSTSHIHQHSHAPTSQLTCSQYTSIPTHMQLSTSHIHQHSHAPTSQLTCNQYTSIPTHMHISTSTAHMHLHSHTPTSQLTCNYQHPQLTCITTHMHQHPNSHATINIHSSHASPLICTNIPIHMQLSTSTAHMHHHSHAPTSQLTCILLPFANTARGRYFWWSTAPRITPTTSPTILRIWWSTKLWPRTSKRTNSTPCHANNSATAKRVMKRAQLGSSGARPAQENGNYVFWVVESIFHIKNMTKHQIWVVLITYTLFSMDFYCFLDITHFLIFPPSDP